MCALSREGIVPAGKSDGFAVTEEDRIKMTGQVIELRRVRQAVCDHGLPLSESCAACRAGFNRYMDRCLKVAAIRRRNREVLHAIGMAVLGAIAAGIVLLAWQW